MNPFGQQQEHYNHFGHPPPFIAQYNGSNSSHTMSSPMSATFTNSNSSYSMGSPYASNQWMSPQQQQQQQQQQPVPPPPLPPKRQQSAVMSGHSTQYPSLSPSMSTASNISALQRSSTYLMPRMMDGRTQYLWDIFQKVDTDRSGTISVHELQAALVNGDWTPFNIETVRLMVSIFDRDNNGTIDFREFHGLWKYIEDWSRCFKEFDYDHSGSIDRKEMQHAIRTFGFNVSDRFVSMLIQTFDKYGRGDITFDNFVQACVTLETLTKLFRARDYENRGSVLINYEDFLTMIISSRPNLKGN